MPRSKAPASPRSAPSIKTSETLLPESTLSYGSPLAAPSDIAVLFLPQGSSLGKEARALDGKLGGMLGAMLKGGDFRGEPLEATSIYLGPQSAARRAVVIGLGEKSGLTLERARRAAGLAARHAREFGATDVELTLLNGTSARHSRTESFPVLAEALLEGFILGSYNFPGLRSEAKSTKRIERVRLVCPKGVSKPKTEAARTRAEATARGVFLARDLAHLPANRLTPTALAEAARRIGRRSPVRVTVFDKPAIQKANMSALLAVARGSTEPPRFITLQYSCGRRRAKRVALVGKGLTFDSGGISLKPANRMEQMKYDMCGAAAVLGVFRTVAEIGAAVDLIGAIPVTENLPSGSAVRPGDVIDSHSGKTIEVLNTDAEGRLVLADAISYVEQTYKPDAIIDLATLTGAIGIALGKHACGLFTEDDALAKSIEEAGLATGERAWRLPIWDDYAEHVKSDIADVKNIANGGTGAGATIGAVFLRRFVGDTKWAHLDIAGVAWDEKGRHYSPRGPSGYGVRLLLNLLDDWNSRTRKGAEKSR